MELLFAVAVQIEYKLDLSLLAHFLDECLDGGDFGAVLVFLADVPLSVEVLAHEIAAVVTEDNSIRIHHRNHINHKILQQKIHLLGAIEQSIH